MKNFIVIAGQPGGCDYTIGCGIDYWFEEAESLDHLISRVEKALLSDNPDDDIDENYSSKRLPGYYEYSYSTLKIIEIGESYNVPLKSLAKDYRKNQDLKREDLKEKQEFEQYERLKEKFETNKLEKEVFNKYCEKCNEKFITKKKDSCICSKCMQKIKLDMIKNKELAKKNWNIKYGLINILLKNGWKTRGKTNTISKQNIKISPNINVEVWDYPILRGSKKTFTWRSSSLEEILDKLPKEARLYIDNYKETFMEK